MLKKILSCVLLTIFCIVFAAGCGSKSTNDNKASSTKGTLIVGLSSEAGTLDPQNTASTNDTRVINNIYDTLVNCDSTGNITPRLAEKWDVSSDNLSYTFHLKSGVKFQNDEVLTANDVKYTFERAIASPYCASFIGAFKSVDVVDNNTVKVSLKYVDPFFLQSIGAKAMSIVNKKSVTEAGKDYGRKPIGTGSYKLSEWTSGDKMVLERFDDCWRGKAPIKTITLRVMSDASARAIALENGEIDVANRIDSSDVDTIKNDPKLKFDSVSSPSVLILGMNQKIKPFDNKLVRQAICYAVDKNTIIQGGADGNGKPAKSLLSEDIAGYADMSYPYNPQKSKELLNQAGYPNGFETTLEVMNVYDKLAPVIQSQLAAVGIKIKIDSMEVNAYLQNIPNNKMYIISNAGDLPNADSCFYTQLSSKIPGESGNLSYTNNKNIDDLLEKGRREADETKRNAIYTQLQALVKEDAANIPLFYKDTNSAYNKDLKGMKTDSNDMFYFYNCSW